MEGKGDLGEADGADAVRLRPRRRQPIGSTSSACSCSACSCPWSRGAHLQQLRHQLRVDREGRAGRAEWPEREAAGTRRDTQPVEHLANPKGKGERGPPGGLWQGNRKDSSGVRASGGGAAGRRAHIKVTSSPSGLSSAAVWAAQAWRGVAGWPVGGGSGCAVCGDHLAGGRRQRKKGGSGCGVAATT